MTKVNLSWFQGASLLIIIISSVYSPTLSNSFIWDDDFHLTQNPFLMDIEGMKRIWFDLRALPQYYPMISTSFWIEHKIWGFDPFGYHAGNILIHCINSFLIWRILVVLKVRGSFLAATIFAIHPVQVETVAWISERKNLLSGLFYFLSLYTFIRFYDPSKINETFESNDRVKSFSTYIISLVFFIFALLSKTVMCSLPAVILVIFWWKQNRVSKKVLLLTAPFFIIGLSFAFLTVWLEQFNAGAIGDEWEFSLIQRFLIAGRALWFYIEKLAFPFPLIFTYPRWSIDDSIWWQYLYPIAFLALLLILAFLRNVIGRGPLAGTLLFSGTLFPALGFFNLYPMKFSFVADHFQYMACIGMIVPFSCGISMLSDRYRQSMVWCFWIIYLSLLGILAWNQSHVYKNTISLWQDTVEKNPGAWMAHYNLGLEYANSGKDYLAVRSYESAIKNKPDYYEAYYNLGNTYRVLGMIEESAESYQSALSINPEHVKCWVNLGLVLGQLKKNEEAVIALRKAIELKPDYVNAYYNLGVIYAYAGQLDEAMKEFENAMRINPNDKEVQNAIKVIVNNYKNK